MGRFPAPGCRRALPLRFLRAFAVLLGCCPAVLMAQEPPARPLLVGYFPQWGIYNQFFVKNLVASGAAGLLDQIDYSQGMIKNNRCVIGDPNADLVHAHTAGNSVDGKDDDPTAPLNGNFRQLQELKRLYPNLKVILSIEGQAKKFAEVAKPENRTAFVTSCIDMFARGHFAPGVEGGSLFDGFDIDWEYPLASEKENFAGLLMEFRRQLDALHGGFRLSIAVAARESRYEGFDLKAIAALVDEINVMSYDYNGSWSHTTGILAPLREIPGDPVSGNTIDATIQNYLQAGVPAAKMLLGLPFYAAGWSGVGGGNHGLFQHGWPIGGEHYYNFIQSIESKTTGSQGSGSNFKLYRDPASQAPWLYDGKIFWSFDDPVSVRAKLEYARKQKLGGVMVWELSNDTADAGLLKVTAEEMRRWGGEK
jgi:chitinase